MPGIGAQGGSVEDVVALGLNQANQDLIINAARSIIFSHNPAHATEKLRNEINQYR